MDTLNDSPLTSLATYLAARRDTLLNNWRTACEQDPTCHAASSLSREEFNNKVPFMLNELENQLRKQRLTAEIELLASEHGLHRWQKGYSLTELLREVHHLTQVVLRELRQFWMENRPDDLEVMVESYEWVSWFNQLNTNGSVEQYVELQRLAAGGRVQTLQAALDKLNGLTRQRGDLLRTASHDLRGSFGIIQGAASFLNLVDAPEAERRQMVEMINRNLKTVRHLVLQLMDLARLEAGEETLNIREFNAGQLLYELVESYQGVAKEAGLLLKADGPAELQVESDPIHIQRIVQNLVLNALKHTGSGWVSVSWAPEGDVRWLISIQDSGPGLAHRPESILPEVLGPSSESTSAFGIPNPEEDAREAAIIRKSKTASGPGEGIGLSIVKGLCELLRASLEIESKAEEGTLFRIRLARQWKR
ncbi:sensor histidine kinase [Larkinella sp. VNQ87]|uniref:sensor histidine kinase n=1 Tax=Larkinella sp. VNQ87 TaxID=3400921 RepID=UPI003C09A49B